MDTNPAEKPVRHILSLSGDKDSTALAIYMRDRILHLNMCFATQKKNYLRHMSIWKN